MKNLLPSRPIAALVTSCARAVTPAMPVHATPSRPSRAKACTGCHCRIEDAHPRKRLTCTTCHRSDPTTAAYERARGMSQQHPKLEEFRQPADFRWDRIVDEDGRPLQATTVDGALPLNRDEMNRIHNARSKMTPAVARPRSAASSLGDSRR